MLDGERRAVPEWSELGAYCLACYAPVADEAPVLRCARCGHVNIRADRARYWTQEPALRRVESGAKAAAFALAAVLFVAVVASGEVRDPLAAWGVGAVLSLLGAALCQAAELVTRRAEYLRPRLFWAGAFLLAPVAAVAFLVICLLLVQAIHLTLPGVLNGAAVLAVYLVPCGVLALLCWRAGPAIEHWKRRRVARGSRARRRTSSAYA